MLQSLLNRALDRGYRRHGQSGAASKRPSKRLAVQQLEARHLLAGDVGAEIVDGTLILTGDDADNAIRVDVVQRVRQDSSGRGLTSVALDADVLAAVNLEVVGASDVEAPAEGFGAGVGFPITGESDFEFTTDGGFAPLEGTIEHAGTVTLGIAGTEIEVTVGEFTIGFDPNRISTSTSGFFVLDNEDLDIILFDVGIPGSLEAEGSLLSIGDADLLVSPEFAEFLLAAELADFDATGVDAGDAQVDVDTADVALRGVRGGETSVGLNVGLLESVGLELSSLKGTASPAGDAFQVAFKILHDSDFVFDQGEGFAPIEGLIEHKGTVGFNDDTLILGDFSIGFDPERVGTETTGFFVRDNKDLGIVLFDVGGTVTVETADHRLKIADASLLVSEELAGALDPNNELELEGVVVGAAQIDAYSTRLKDEFIRVSGNGLRGRTTINGERSVEFPAEAIENLVIETGAGQDTVRINGVSLPGNLTVELGNGWRNTATLHGVHVDGVMSILGGDGRDSVRLIRTGAGSLDIDTGANSDSVYLLLSKVDGDADIDLGSDRDRLSVVRSHIGGTADFDGGSGSDQFYTLFSRYGDLQRDGFRTRHWWF